MDWYNGPLIAVLVVATVPTIMIVAGVLIALFRRLVLAPPAPLEWLYARVRGERSHPGTHTTKTGCTPVQAAIDGTERTHGFVPAEVFAKSGRGG